MKSNKYIIKFVLHIIGILNKSLNRYIILITGIVAGALLIWHLSINDYNIYPSNNSFGYHYYNDSANGGNSQIICGFDGDSVIGFNFKLNNRFFTPYVGINFTNYEKVPVNISSLNQFEIDVLCRNMEYLGFYLFTLNNIDDTKREICFHYNIKLKPGRNTYKVNLSQLNVPDWWFAANNLLPDKNLKPNLDKMAYFNLGSAYTTDFDSVRTLKVYRVGFTRSNRLLILIVCLGLVFELLIMIVIHHMGIYIDKIKKQHIISYKPVDFTKDKKPSDQFINYINENFQNLDLNLETVAKETGVHSKVITNAIHSTYGLNFKTYINQLRITESKRLLQETNFSIGEVAFNVGFNNQSHFNRVFKAFVGKSPTEFKAENS